MKKEPNKNLKIALSDYKIMYALYLLNAKHIYPNNVGLYHILTGARDDETLEYKDYPCYALLTSYSSKKISRMVNMLVRYKYVARIYDKNSDALYLRLSELGDDAIKDYLVNHTIKPHVKKASKVSNFYKI